MKKFYKEELLFFIRMSRKSFMILKIILLASLLTAQNAIGVPQQKVKITGLVTDGSTGDILPGVNIRVEGTIAGVIVGPDGKYEIEIDKSDAVLIFSFIGYVNHRVAIQGKTVINVALLPQEKILGDVVVVGYGTQKKVNLTGSVTSVDADRITTRPVTQTSSALQGLAPGVVVTQNLGSPGNDAATIRIRGAGSISSDNSPLIMVDGIQIENINDVAPEDIASISILKDAASAAIYGSRAANGVILITTKRGKMGDFTVSADLSYGAQMPTMTPKFVSIQEQFLYEDTRKVNGGQSPEWGKDYIKDFMDFINTNGPDDQHQNNDWYNAVVANSAPLQRQQFTLSGGSEKVNARLSLINLEQDGLIENSNFNRKSVRANVDLKPLPWLSFTSDIFVQRSEQKQPATNQGTLFQMVNELEPYRQMIVGDGLYGWAWRGENPLGFIQSGGTSTDKKGYTMINLNGIITPIEGLRIELGYSNLVDNDLIDVFQEKFPFYSAGATADDEPTFSGYNPSVNSLNMLAINRTQNYYKAQASYHKKFGDHELTFLTVADATNSHYRELSGYRSNFPLGVHYPQLSLGGRDGMNNGSTATEWAMASLLGRGNYIYKDRYLLEATVRYDGSSRFASEKRWGVFPAVSAGWRLSEENFMKSISSISNLKIRASWGKLGNQNIGSNYPYQSLVDLNQPALFGEVSQLGAAVTSWAVRGITWEKSTQTNFGFDFGLFENKLTGSFDYYVKKTSDILLILAIPQSSGLAANYQNGAEIENKGWEFMASWQDIIGKLTYYVTGQIDDNKNKVTNLLGTGPYINNNRIMKEGEEFNALYGYESIGFLSKSDLTDPNVPKQVSSFLMEGSLKFKDQNGDKVIDANDRVIIGSEVPRFNYSISTGANFEGFELDVIFQGVGKRDGYVDRGPNQSYGDHMYDWEKDFYIAEDSPIFTVHHYDEVGLKPNTNASFPAWGADNGGTTLTSFWIQSRAYLRIKNVTLSYTLPKALVSQLKMSNVRFYVSGENLYTFTNFIKGFDPEMTSGAGFWEYPNISRITGGLNITF